MKILKKLHEMASIIITLFIVAIFAVMMFAVIKGVNNWRNPQVWIEAGFCSLLQIIMVFTWLPEGKKRGEQNQTFIDNRGDLNERVEAAVKAENFDRLTHFCEYATQQNIIAWISKKVSRYGVAYTQWIDKDTGKKYQEQFDEKIINKVLKIERKALSNVHVIKPTEVTSATQVHLVFDTVDHSKGVEKVKVALKIATSLIMSVIGAFIAFEGAKFSVQSLIDFIYWNFVMLMSIFFAVRTGYRLMTVERNDYFKRMIDFLKRFEAWKEDDQDPVAEETTNN